MRCGMGRDATDTALSYRRGAPAGNRLGYAAVDRMPPWRSALRSARAPPDGAAPSGVIGSATQRNAPQERGEAERPLRGCRRDIAGGAERQRVRKLGAVADI